MTDPTQASLDAFAVESHDDRSDDPADGADRESWPSRWTCPNCDFTAEYELHGAVTPTCPRCLPETFVRMEGQS